MRNFLLLFLAVSFSPAAFGQVLFEGFYRIEKSGRHVGYMIQRHARDTKAGTRTLTTFVHTKINGDDFFETIKSVANDKTLKPIESVHGGNTMGSFVETAATFKGPKAWVEMRNPRNKKAIDKKNIEARYIAFPGAFLFYAADVARLQYEKNYDFNFYAERAGRPAYGQLSLIAEEKSAAGPVRHVVIDVLGEPNENFLAANGDPLGSRSPADGTVVFWVKSKEEAVGTMEYPNNNFIALFGDLPEGKKNPWSKIPDFNALKVIDNFKKSFGNRKLAVKEREKITVPLVRRAN